MRLLKISTMVMAIVMFFGVVASGSIAYASGGGAGSGGFAGPMTWTPAWQNGETPPAWSQDAVNKAAGGTSQGILGTGMHGGGGGFNAQDGGDVKGGALELCVYMNTLGLMAWYEPNLKAFPGTKNEITVSQALANQIALVLRPDPAGAGTALRNGHSPAPTGRGGIGEWVDGTAALALALAKHNPSVWNLVSEEDKARADVIMTSLAISGNYLHNFENTPKTDMSKIYEWYKNWNPNLTEGYVDMMIGIYYYFGGADEVNAIFANYDYDAHIAKLDQYGYAIIKGYHSKNKNLLVSGGTDSKSGTYTKINGLNFTYKDINTGARIQYNPIELYKSVAKVMYNRVASSEIYSGGVKRGYISDGSKSPFDGLLGMCNELNSMDANGLRSDGGYVLDNWKTSIPAAATVKAFGDWKGEGINDIESRMYVGSEDFLFKIDPARGGYRGWEKGKASLFDENSSSTGWHGYICVKDIWQKMLKDETGYEAGYTLSGGTLNVNLKAYNLSITNAQTVTVELEIYNSVGGLHTSVKAADITVPAKTSSKQIGSLAYSAWQDGYRARLIVNGEVVEIVDPSGALSKPQAANVLSISNINIYREDEEYCISADINNTFTTEQSAPLMVILYDGEGNLVSVIPVVQDIEEGYRDTFDFVYNGELQSGYTVKIMAWNSALVPYCPAEEIPVSEI